MGTHYLFEKKNLSTPKLHLFPSDKLFTSTKNKCVTTSENSS